MYKGMGGWEGVYREMGEREGGRECIGRWEGGRECIGRWEGGRYYNIVCILAEEGPGDRNITLAMFTP